MWDWPFPIVFQADHSLPSSSAYSFAEVELNAEHINPEGGYEN